MSPVRPESPNAPPTPLRTWSPTTLGEERRDAHLRRPAPQPSLEPRPEPISHRHPARLPFCRRARTRNTGPTMAGYSPWTSSLYRTSTRPARSRASCDEPSGAGSKNKLKPAADPHLQGRHTGFTDRIRCSLGPSERTRRTRTGVNGFRATDAVSCGAPSGDEEVDSETEVAVNCLRRPFRASLGGPDQKVPRMPTSSFVCLKCRGRLTNERGPVMP